MKLVLKVEKEFDVKKLKASCGVRYWEDATVNGKEDTNGDLIPCRNGDCFEPIICIESGLILNWEKGKTASLHYKVCDAGEYTLICDNDNEIKTIEGYVPSMMCPKGGGYGDYVIMDIDEDGVIANWSASFDDFEE